MRWMWAPAKASIWPTLSEPSYPPSNEPLYVAKNHLLFAANGCRVLKQVLVGSSNHGLAGFTDKCSTPTNFKTTYCSLADWTFVFCKDIDVFAISIL